MVDKPVLLIVKLPLADSVLLYNGIISLPSAVDADTGAIVIAVKHNANKATKILLDSELYLVDDPCFTVKSLVTTIKDYCLSKQVKTVCFDYIANNGYVARELSANSGIPQREDMILLAFNDAISQIDKKMEDKLGKYKNIPGLHGTIFIE